MQRCRLDGPLPVTLWQPAAGAGLELDAPAATTATLAFLALAIFLSQKVEVHSCTELREALANPAVEHVLLMPRPSGDNWNCTAADFPPFSVEISSRDVLMEGYGDKQLYYDVSVGLGSAKAAGGCWCLLAHGACLAEAREKPASTVLYQRCAALHSAPPTPTAGQQSEQPDHCARGRLADGGQPVGRQLRPGAERALHMPGHHQGCVARSWAAGVPPACRCAACQHAICRELSYLRLSFETPAAALTPLSKTRRRLADIPRQPDQRRQLPAHQAVRTGQLGGTGIWLPDGPEPGAV